MADEKTPPEGEQKPAGMTLEEATKVLGDIAPKIAAMQEQLAALAKPLEKVDEVVEADKVPAALAGMDSAIKGIGATVAKLQGALEGFAADAAAAPKRYFAEVAARDQLANDLSAHVGAFDHREMTSAEVAAYGVKKLGLTVAAGQERAALDGYLAAAKNQVKHHGIRIASIGMDGAGTGQNKTISGYIAGKKE